MTESLLTLNAGSSSLKFALFDIGGAGGPRLSARGEIEQIAREPTFTVRDGQGALLADRRLPRAAGDIEALLGEILGWADANVGRHGMAGVGHRVVHGGPDHARPERVTPDLLAALERLVPLAPLHQPLNLAPIRLIAAARPGLPQAACFDTAFHHTMPPVARRFALPREYETMGVRRYGFHGLSYEFVAARLRETAPALAARRVVVAHLGNGASLCALDAGRSVDTTMGFSALDGLVMGTRPGSLDPGVMLHLMRERGMTAEEIEDLLYRKSGLLGVSGGISSDMRTLLASPDPRADEAVELFTYRIARETAAMAAALGGLDGLVFTAGMGEHAPPVRAAVCARLKWLGVELDRQANERNATVISAPDSRVEVRVVPTDEERMIALHTIDAIGRSLGPDHERR